MKTLTEFPGTLLKLASKTQQEYVSAGKAPEELLTHLGATLKLEGDRLTLLQTSLEIVGHQHANLKRVVIFTLHEGEKAPSTVIQREAHCFLVEHYPSLDKPASQPSAEIKKGDGRRNGKGGPGKGPRNPRNESGPRQPKQTVGERPSPSLPKPRTTPV